jgi:hypothetical protein
MSKVELRYFAALVAIFGALACAKPKYVPPPPKTQWIAPDYAEQDLGDSMLTIVADQGELHVVSAYAVETIYLSVLFRQMTGFVRSFSNFTDARLAPGPATTPLTKRQLEIDPGRIVEISLPPAGGTARFGDWTTRFVLFLGPIRLEDDRPDMTSPGDEGAWVTQKAAFAFWDNKQGRLVSYGEVDVRQPFCDPDRILFCNPDDLSDEEAEFLAGGFIAELFRDTPFMKRRKKLKPPKNQTLSPLPPKIIGLQTSTTATTTAR